MATTSALRLNGALHRASVMLRLENKNTSKQQRFKALTFTYLPHLIPDRILICCRFRTSPAMVDI